MDSIPSIILQNPYRILGVYANAAKKDIVANKGKATAFLKVNKPVEYPLDLKGILPAPNRTLDLMNEAEAHLAIAKEQIKYAQFWFLTMTPIDDVAFNHLVAGNITGAMEIWSKQKSLSSLQNRLVCYLITNKTEQAVKTAEKLYAKFGEEFISKVDANCTLQMSGTELLYQFVDSLGEEIGMQRLMGFDLGSDTKAYISSQTVGPLINKISSEVDKTKKVDHKDPNARNKAGLNLMMTTREPLQQLKSILTVEDSQYQMIADKVGLEILQCGIDYFNNSDDEDKHRAAMNMQKYAQSIVVGTLAKQRCNENVRILKEIIDSLPPISVMEEDRAIKQELRKFVQLPDKIEHSMNLLRNTKQHVQSIKRELGISNAYYLKISTQIIQNALHNVIEEVNAIQDDSSLSLSIRLGLQLSYSQIESLRGTFRRAWAAIELMDEFDLSSDFSVKYKQNRSTLRSMCSSMGISVFKSTSSYGTIPNPRNSIRPRPYTPPSDSYFDEKTTEWLKENWGCLLIIVIIIIVAIANCQK